MITCVLTDIEGTTSSIEFVHKVLFPYARANFFEFLSTSKDPAVNAEIQALWTGELKRDPGSKPDIGDVTKLLQSWIDQDLKIGSLKLLQGKIWAEGFASKAYLAHVYPDVKAELERWHESGLTLAIYSSGSVEAQKLLFKHTEAGDLTPLFSAFYDTAVGHKREAKSYQTIVSSLGLPPGDVLFLSDIKEELDAAGEAGLQPCQLLREPPPLEGHHRKAKTFYEVTALFFPKS